MSVSMSVGMSVCMVQDAMPAVVFYTTQIFSNLMNSVVNSNRKTMIALFWLYEKQLVSLTGTASKVKQHLYITPVQIRKH